MLRTEKIEFAIGVKKILNGISVVFRPGEFNMILGPNGSGKSTFLKIFSGELRNFKGDVFYTDTSLKNYPSSDLAKFRSVLSQHPVLDFPLLVEEVVMMARYPHFTMKPTKHDISVCREALHRMGIWSLKERNYLTLSGGEKQRVQFARALAQIWEKSCGTRYLFLDEPLNSLDIRYQHEFLQIAKEFSGNDTVLIAVIHDVNLAAQYADRLFIMKNGQLITQGAPDKVLCASLIQEVFDVSCTITENSVLNKPMVVVH